GNPSCGSIWRASTRPLARWARQAAPSKLASIWCSPARHCTTRPPWGFMPSSAVCTRKAMPLSVAIQMDPIERIDIGGDSTFALALEAESRGHALLYYGPRDLTFRDGAVTARCRPVTVRNTRGDHFTAGE